MIEDEFNLQAALENAKSEPKNEEPKVSSENNNDMNLEFSQIQLAYNVAQEEILQLKDRIVRDAAEHDNFRKRSVKQIDDAKKFAISSFSKDLIEVLENLYLATDNIPSEALVDESLKAVFEGVEMTKTILINIFEKYGINRVFPQVGDNFDHNLHQAVSHIEQPELASNAIVSVMRAGYVLHDRLIKPAMVIVAKNT